MSSHEHTTTWTDTSEHHGFHVHVLPLKVYLGVFAALMVLTVATVGLWYLDPGHIGVTMGLSENLHHPINMILSMIIATTKASLVAMIFMHLWFDNKFYLLLFLGSLLFLAIFIIVTMFDTERRGDIYEYRDQTFGVTGDVDDVADFEYYKNPPPMHHDEGDGHGDEGETHAAPADAEDSHADEPAADATPAAADTTPADVEADGHEGHDH